MASGAQRLDRDDGVRVQRGGRMRRDVWGLAVLAIGALAGVLVIRSGDSAPPAPSGERVGPAPPAPVAGAAGSSSKAATEPALPTSVPRSRGAKLRALRTLGVTPTRDADGKRRLDAAPVIDALNKAGIHDGIAAFPPPGTDPPKAGVIVPDGIELPEGYVRHFQTTDDGQELPPILMFHPDYTFTDALGNPIEIPPDRIVPPDLVPEGFPVKILEIPARDGAR